MSQAILISDNEVINSLYEVNLRAYVATNVTIKKSLEDAIKLIEQSPNIDAVICFNHLASKNNAFELLFNYLKENELKIPIIILGKISPIPGKTIVIENRYDIKALLQAMAKILSVTAKDMAKLEVPEFFPIPLKLFAKVESACCDIYFRDDKDDFNHEYFKIIEKGSSVEGSLGKYYEAGVEHLYIDAINRLQFINRASASVVNELKRDDLSHEERLEITQQGMSVVAEEVFASDEVSERVAEISRACIDSIKETIKDVPKLKKLLKMLLENKGDVSYKHSVISTYIATEILKHISWGSEEQANKVAFALFFHDIYLIQIYRKYPDAIVEEDLLFRDDVDEKDKQIVIEHAKKAGQLIKSFPKCPMGADMIITQHHGMTNGEGFAVNYKDDISPLSKIMIISEEVTMNILLATQDTPLEKFEVDKEAMIAHLSEKYRNHTYKKIIQAFNEIEI